MGMAIGGSGTNGNYGNYGEPSVQGRRESRRIRSDGAVAVDGRRMPRVLVIGDHGLGFGAVLGEAVGEGVQVVVGAAAEWAAASGAGIGRDWRRGCRRGRRAPQAWQTRRWATRSRMTASSARMRTARSTAAPCSRQHRVEGFGLADGAGIAVERPRAAWPASHWRTTSMVISSGTRRPRSKNSAARRPAGVPAAFCSRSMAPTDGHAEAEALLQEFRLGSLAGSGRPEQHEATMHEPGPPTADGWRRRG